MNTRLPTRGLLLSCILVSCLNPFTRLAEAAAVTPASEPPYVPRDGQHDFEGVGLRLYNPKSRQWSLNWASSRDGVMGRAMIGEFVHGEGHFYDQEDFQGRSILDRNGFSDIKPDSSRFEQAFFDGSAAYRQLK